MMIFFLWHCRPNRAYAALLLKFIDHTHTDTRTEGKTPLDKWSARLRGRNLNNTQQTQQKNIRAPSGIEKRDPSYLAAADLRVRKHSHRNRQMLNASVNKMVQPDATVCRHSFTAESLYMFRGSQHLSSGVLKTVPATSGISHAVKYRLKLTIVN